MKRSALSLVVIGALVAACASAPSQPGAPSSASAATGDACTEKRSSALDLVSSAIEANRGCASDTECVIVALGAGCFDACGRVMAASGKAAYEQAVADANAKYCDAYKSSGCPAAIPPPCAPNPPPACKAGKCE